MMLTKKMRVILLNFMVNLKMMTAVMIKRRRGEKKDEEEGKEEEKSLVSEAQWLSSARL